MTYDKEYKTVGYDIRALLQLTYHNPLSVMNKAPETWTSSERKRKVVVELTQVLTSFHTSALPLAALFVST